MNIRILKAVLIIISLGWICFALLMKLLEGLPFATAIVTIIFSVITYLMFKRGIL